MTITVRVWWVFAVRCGPCGSRYDIVGLSNREVESCEGIDASRDTVDALLDAVSAAMPVCSRNCAYPKRLPRPARNLP